MLGEVTSPDSWEGVAWFLGACAVRGAVVLTVAVLIHGVLRKASAGSRHAVAVAALMGVLLLPMVTLLAPSISVAVLPEEARSTHGEAALSQPAEMTTPLMPPVNAINTVEDAPSPTTLGAATLPALAPSEPHSATRFSLTWPMMLLLAWVTGALIALLPTLAGLWNVTRKALRARSVADAEWLRLLDAARERLDVRRSVRLLQSDAPEIPTTWGLFRSVILLPSDAALWPEERRNIVLLHELAHIKRLDYATQLIAYLVRALHWFNPLAWLSVRALRMDSERACDDLLVTAGSKPSDYARHLIDMVRTLRPASSAAFVAIAMARRTRLERRVRAILDKRLRRSAVTRRTLAATLTFALALSGILAVLHPVARVLADEGDGIARATFPCGANVELVAIRKHRSDDKTFWRPDGTPVNDPPYESSGTEVGLPEGYEAYEISVVASNLPAGVSRCSVESPNAWGGEGGVSEKSPWRDDKTLRISTMGYPAGTKTVTVRVKIPDARWEPLCGWTFGEESGRVGSGDPFVAYGEHYVKDGELRLTVTDNMAERYARLVAFDEAGKRHPASMLSSTDNGNSMRMGTYCIANLKEEDTWQCKALQLETCGYETFEFRNVSLIPGTHTTEVSSGTARQQAERHLKYLGLVFKMFANESPGEVFPLKSGEDGVFLPETSQIFPEYVTNTPDTEGLMAYLQGQRGVDLCYFGHVIKSEEEAMALLDAYEQEGVEDFRGVDITVVDPEGSGEPIGILRIREGIERFLITDINNPAASALAQSEIPVLWELPDSLERNGKGGFVLYMDGHVEWLDYPGEFPMSEAFVKRIRAMMSTPREKRSGQVRPVAVTVHHPKPSPVQQRRLEAVERAAAVLARFAQTGWTAEEYAKYVASLSGAAREREDTALAYSVRRALHDADLRRKREEARRRALGARARRHGEPQAPAERHDGEDQNQDVMRAETLQTAFGPRVRIGVDGGVFVAFWEASPGPSWTNVAVGEKYAGLRLDQVMEDRVLFTDLESGKQFDASVDDRVAGMRAAEAAKKTMAQLERQ